MRCFSRSHAKWAQAIVTVSVRLVKRRLSPDRTHNEEIQDRQNAFVWSEKHIFRPHQHFTYDPSSWSRPLEEKMKAKRRLSLVDRLRVLEEREEEAAAASAGVAMKSTELSENTEDIDYFYSPEETATPTVSLQGQLDRLNELRVLLTAPRYTDASLSRVERLRREYKETLCTVFERARVAVVGKTMTFDALLYLWFLLLEGAEPLLEALIEKNKGENEENVSFVIVTVRNALDILLLHAMQCMDTIEKEKIILEGLVELLDVVTHPFTRHGGRLRESELHSSTAPVVGEDDTTELLARSVLPHTMAALTERMMMTHDGTELLDLQHLHSLLRGLTRCGNLIDESHLQRVVLLTRKVIEGVLTRVKSVIAPSLGHSVRHSLLGKTLRRFALEDASETIKKDISRQVILDACDPPRGVKDPITDADEVSHAVSVCRILLRQTAHSSQVTRGKVIEVVDTLLMMLAYAPNYELSVADTAAFVCAMLEGGLLNISDSGSIERHLRMILLLSRLKFSTCHDQAVLCPLLCFMCRVAPPDACTLPVLLEWKRLYGIVMHQLLLSVRAGGMNEHYVPAYAGDEGSGGWEELLAHGQYGGSIPLSLWRDSCQLHFSGATSLSSDGARALLSLRTRCRHYGGESFAGKSRPSPAASSPLDFDSVQLIAQLLHVLLGDRVAAEDFINEAAAWEVAQNVFVGDKALCALLRGAQRCVQERQLSKRTVMTFS